MPGTVLTGRGLDDILQEILVPYQAPAFSSFSLVGSTSIVEVGCVINNTPVKTFSWTCTNGINVSGGTMCVRDTTLGSNLAVNISTISPATVTINPVTFSTYGQTQTWGGSAKNTKGTQFNTTQTVTAYYPYYWGVCTCPGPSGANRPIPDSAMVAGGNKVLQPSGGPLSIDFNSGADDYLWFAIPSTVVPIKTAWYVPALSVGGTIGGSTPGTNLFPAPVPAITVTTACWTKTYDVYISNKQSEGSNPMVLS